jgi:hypothetical protein
MKVIIDTSSLLSLVRYYLPFDKKGVLMDFIKAKIDAGEIVILDAVVKECQFNAQGLVLKEIPFLSKVMTDTSLILPYPKFFNLLENSFCNQPVKKMLTETEFENRKNDFFNTADPKLILYSQREKKANREDKVIIVTEETEASNDGKVFKKIPAICRIMGIECITFPKLIEIYDGIDIEFR